jgi:hypothetical protein
VPSHVGITGNEKADKAARKAPKGAVINQVCLTSISQCKLTAERLGRQLWKDLVNQDNIRLPDSKSWTWFCRVHEAIPPNLGGKSRQVISIVSRIKLGHIHWINTPKYARCPCGSTVLSMAHVLVTCKKLNHTPLLQNLRREELVSISEIYATIKVLSWCEMAGWTYLIKFYELNQRLTEGVDV